MTDRLRSRTAAVLLAALLVAGVAGVAVVLALGGGESAAERPGIVAVVDGLEVTEDEWRVALNLAESGLAFMQDEAATGEEESALGALVAMLERRIELAERHGLEVMAMAGLVVERATEAEARRRGFTATETDVASALEEQQRLHEQVMGSEIPGSADARETIEGMIALVGEDGYWDVIGGWQRSALTVAPLSEVHHRLSPRQTEPPERWDAVRLRLAREARVELGPEMRDTVTAAAIDAYLHDALTLEREPGEAAAGE